MTLEELGQAIKEKREAAGMSLDDVAGRLKISVRILRTLEEGSVVGLPHAVYAKSFIRSFGQVVGYAPQELNAALEELFPPDAFDESKAESILRAHPAMTYYPDAGKRFAIILLLLALIGGLIGGSWYVAVTYGDKIIETIKMPFSAITSSPEATRVRQPNLSVESPEASSSILNTLSVFTAQPSPSDGQALPSQVVPPPDAPAASPPNTIHDSPAPAGVNDFNSENIENNSALQANNDADSSQQAIVNAGLDEHAPEQTEDEHIPVNMEASTPDGKNRLVIRVHAECWISSRADGGRARENMLYPGMNFAITYNDRLELIFGNAGGVSLSHNGRELGAPGASGRVVVMRFPEQ